MVIFVSILTLCSWVLVAGLIYFLIRIARFYQKKYRELYDAPGQRTYHPFFWIPLFLFVLAAGRYAFLDDLAGDAGGDVAFFVGGVVLTALSLRLQQLMTGGRR
jgi:hypothetical protein